MINVMARTAAVLWVVQAIITYLTPGVGVLPFIIHSIVCFVAASVVAKGTKQAYWGVTLFPVLIAGVGVYFAWVTHNETALIVSLGVITEVTRIQLIAAPVIAGLIVLTKRILK